MPTFQIRYLIDWLLIIANFTFESLFVSFKELSIKLLHPPLLIIFVSINFIQFLLFMLMKWVLPFNLVKAGHIAYLIGLQVFLMSIIPLIACDAIVISRRNIFRLWINIKAVSKSFWRNMFLFFEPLLLNLLMYIILIIMILKLVIHITYELVERLWHKLSIIFDAKEFIVHDYSSGKVNKICRTLCQVKIVRVRLIKKFEGVVLQT